MDTQTHATLDYQAILARLDAFEAKVNYLVERQKKTEELFSEMTPILREVMSTATTKLDVMDKKGYFAFGRELVNVGERILDGFSPDDVRALGDAIVGILETVRAATQPKALQIAGEAMGVLENAEQAEPLGIMGMVRATRDDDVQKGMAVMMEVMRHVGRGARAIAEQRKATSDRKDKLAAALGPRKKVLGVERTRPKGAVAASKQPAKPDRPASSCATPRSPAPAAAVIDGVAFTADGHLADFKVWSDALATKLAAAQGLELDEARWKVIRFAREDFEKVGASPNIRRLTQGTSLATKDLYVLFPKAPARTVAKIAGIPKPAGCI